MNPLNRILAAVLAVTLLFLGCVVWYSARLRRVTREAAEAQLALKGQIVAEAETSTGLRRDLDVLLAKNAELRRAYEQAVALAPGSKPVRTAHLDTGPLPVQSAPPVAGGAPAEGSGGLGPQSAPPGTPPNPPCPLGPADKLSLSVDQVELQAKGGAHLVVGTATATAIPAAGEPWVLASGRFKAPVSDANALVVPEPRWGAMLIGACGASGCGLGAAALLPPLTLPVLTWRVETFVGVVALPGALVAQAGVGARW